MRQESNGWTQALIRLLGEPRWLTFDGARTVVEPWSLEKWEITSPPSTPGVDLSDSFAPARRRKFAGTNSPRQIFSCCDNFASCA